MPHTIHALSFDADNCIFHCGYNPTIKDILSGQCQQSITQNLPLLDSLKTQTANYKKTILLDGSLRQSQKIDLLNSQQNTTESFFTVLQKIALYLEVTLDKFLLADIYANVAHGTSFDHAVSQSYGQPNRCFEDATKLTILYSQTHRMANQYPNDMILFDFYDDRGLGTWDIPKDLLEDLQTYFTQHPELLPNNLTLRLNHYEGKQVTPFPVIQGKGFIDANYEKTTNDIGGAALTGHDILTIKPKHLHTRKPLILEDAGYTTDEATSSAAPSPGPSPSNKQSNLPAHYLGSLFYDLGYTDADNNIIENHCKTLQTDSEQPILKK